MAAGSARVRAAGHCPCGSGETFSGCCGPALSGMPPLTAEALMRSRYTAFARGDATYVAQSWHPGTRPEDIRLDSALAWRGLEVLDVQGGAEGEVRGTVEFRAHWREGGHDGVLSERSRFVRQSGRWWYLDGKVQ